MANLNSSNFQGKFYDDTNFPEGFHRSGDFTRKHADLLTDCGKLMRALYLGAKQPETDAEQSFVDVFSGLKEACSEEERVWQKYLKAIDRRNEYITHLTRAPGLEIRTTPDIKASDINDGVALEDA